MGRNRKIPVKLVLCHGKAAIAKAKVTAAEARVLMQYEKFYEIERLLDNDPKRTMPRL